MAAATPETLVQKKCLPCEGGIEACTLAESQDQLAVLPGWRLTHEGKRIRRDWKVRDFKTAIDFFGRITELAEADNHHPDLHVEAYRNVSVELWTHAIDGLSENDFILAAKIDRLPVEPHESA